ncbi:MAG: serine/threonine protein phosphatase, partial [Chitinophagaceae bacterium]
IHGGLKALQQLLRRMQGTPQDRLIFIGDYVDGWPDSAATIAYLIDLEKSYGCIFIKGNHDVWCEEWLAGGPPDETWLSHGGRSTIKSYESCTGEVKDQHLLFFRRMHNYFIDEENRLFIHAGFSSMQGPAHEHYASNFKWDRTLWEMALTMDKRIAKDSSLYPKRLLLFKEIYIGHTPTLNYDVELPMKGCNVWNLDTGAAYYGKLSAMNIDNKAIFQSDKVQELYPNDKGRNK